jgi:hypothetical protein
VERGEVLFGGELIDCFIGAEKECGFQTAFVAAREILAHEVSFSFRHLVPEQAGVQ